MLYTDAGGGRWVSPFEAIFTVDDAAGDEAQMATMYGALVRTGMPIVHVPAAVVELLRTAAQSFGDWPRWLWTLTPRPGSVSHREILASGRASCGAAISERTRNDR